MADITTTHRVVEKIEVTGEEEAAAAFSKLGGITGAVARVFGLTKTKVDQTGAAMKAAGDTADALGSKSEKAGRSGESAGKGFKLFSGEMFKGAFAADLLGKAVQFVLGALRDMAARFWEVNEVVEAAQSRTQGLMMGLAEFGDIDPGEKIARSLRGANALLDEMKSLAMDTAQPLAGIESGFSKILPAVASMGKNMASAMTVTRAGLSAAKVYGEGADAAGNIIGKALAQGVVEGDSAFAQTIKNQLGAAGGAFAKLGMEERFKKVIAVLEQMGAPIKTVTQDTAGALARWKILSDDVLQRVTVPVYERIGRLVQSVVDWTEKHKGAIDRVVEGLGNAFVATWELGAGLWSAGSAILEASGAAWVLGNGISRAWDLAKGFWRVLDLVGHAFKVVGEGVRVLADPSRGMGKLNVLADGFYLKILKVVQAFADVLRGLAKLVVPEWVQKRLPKGAQGFIGEIGETYDYFDRLIARKEADVAAREQKLGMDPTTELGRRNARAEAGIGLDAGAREKLLASIFGKKSGPVVQIDKIEIKQDFRDQDPDRVAIEFVRDIERLAENALQSAAGNGALTFGPGGY